jgi:hypothetical protein
MMLGRAIARLAGRIDARARGRRSDPSTALDGTRHRAGRWDLRTVIALFPPSCPLRFLNLNVTHGRTGLPFDQRCRTAALADDESFDLQLCLAGRDDAERYKREHRLGVEVRSAPGRVDIALDDRLRFAGCWPSYAIEYRQPEALLALDLALAAWPGLHWWARLGNGYSHYTGFATATVAWRWRERSDRIEVAALHDHGFGRTVPRRLGALLRLFRYEVLRLPGEGHALAVHAAGPGGVALRSEGVLRPSRGAHGPTVPFTTEVLAWAEHDNAAGRPCRVPRRWVGRLGPRGGELRYEAAIASVPCSVLGDGFLYAFDYTTDDGATVGEGYAEQLGRGWLVT